MLVNYSTLHASRIPFQIPRRVYSRIIPIASLPIRSSYSLPIARTFLQFFTTQHLDVEYQEFSFPRIIVFPIIETDFSTFRQQDSVLFG